MRNHVLGGLAALVLILAAACSGGNTNPTASFPAVPGVGSTALPSSGSSQITMPQTSGLAVGSADISGTGTVAVTQSATNPSAVPVLQLKRRADSAANTPIAYVTVTATTTATLAQVQLLVSPTASISSGTYYVAFWNGSQWVTVGKPATVSGSVISVSTGTLSPAVSLSAGSSYYLAIYSGNIFTTPTPPPPAPVVSPSALTLSEGQTGTLTVTTGEDVTITATSSDTSVATVTSSVTTAANATTANFTVTAALATGNATITFTDPLGHSTTAAVTVNNTAPTPMPSPANATIGLGDGVYIGISAKPSTQITVTSAGAGIAPVAAGGSGTPAPGATPPASFSGSATVTTDATGAAYFWVSGKAGGSTTISLTDPFSDTGTMSVVVSAITNGAFANGLNGWSACSYPHADLAAPVNAASPLPNSPETTQGTGTSTPVPAGSIPPVTVTTPPQNDNPGPPSADNITVPVSIPSQLGNAVALTGSVNAGTVPYPSGAFGMCQSVAVPAAAPYLSFYVFEGGEYYNFDNADQEAVILDSTGATIKQTLFAEQDCYLHPGPASGGKSTAGGAFGGAGVNTDNGCWPAAYGGDVNSTPYNNWIQGGFWQPRGPYDLSSYAGQTVTLFLGNWSYYHDTATYYAQFMFVGDVQLVPSNTFPTNAPLARGRSLGTIKLTHRVIK